MQKTDDYTVSLYSIKLPEYRSHLIRYENKNFLEKAYVLKLNGEKLVPPRYKNIYRDSYGKTYTYFGGQDIDVGVWYRVNGAPYYEAENHWYQKKRREDEARAKNPSRKI